MLEELPAEFDAFSSFLGGEGLRCTQDESPPDCMGYRVIEFTNRLIGVRAERDRGPWDLEIADRKNAPGAWYPIPIFSYLLPGPKRPAMTFVVQLQFTKDRWQGIVALFEVPEPMDAHARLHAAANERILEILPLWPKAILVLEAFLQSKGLACTAREDPRDLYADREWEYADSALAVRMSSKGGWHLQFAGATSIPRRWHSLGAVRCLLKGHADHRLPFNQWFPFIMANWTEIAARFAPAEIIATEEKLAGIEAE